MVTLRRTTALEPALEAQSLCADVLSAVDTILNAAAAGPRALIANEAGRLGHRATQYRARFRAMASEIDR
jgi:hypothetical protein